MPPGEPAIATAAGAKPHWLGKEHEVLLENLGWNAYFECLWRDANIPGCAPARVVSQQRKFWRVAGEFGECWAEPSGKLRLAAESHSEWPAVGDWVAAEIPPSPAREQRAIIHGVLPRRSQFVRKAAGKALEVQVVAANVDTALLVSALDEDFNLRRIERYLAQCWESGASPVVVLNKADVCPDAAALAGQVERIALGAPVIAVSALSGEGLVLLEPFLLRGHTLVFLGSSGVGKSTLVNRLVGRGLQPVQPVRARDGRGRHTTTARQLIFLPRGAMVIDTPGLRELQLWDASNGLAEVFADVGALAARCRFRNCRHETEPGCAVQAALAEGTLDEERLESRRKLEREQEFLRRKMDPEARQKEKQRIKTIYRALRQRYRFGKTGEEER